MQYGLEAAVAVPRAAGGVEDEEKPDSSGGSRTCGDGREMRWPEMARQLPEQGYAVVVGGG